MPRRSPHPRPGAHAPGPSACRPLVPSPSRSLMRLPNRPCPFYSPLDLRRVLTGFAKHLQIADARRSALSHVNEQHAIVTQDINLHDFPPLRLLTLDRLERPTPVEIHGGVAPPPCAHKGLEFRCDLGRSGRAQSLERAVEPGCIRIYVRGPIRHTTCTFCNQLSAESRGYDPAAFRSASIATLLYWRQWPPQPLPGDCAL